MFVTSTSHTANLGGLAGADRICNHRAHVAKLPGRYKAWLSDETASPHTRFTRNQGSYVLTNGRRIANNWSDLTDGTLLAPINIAENGKPVSGESFVWTATKSSGTIAVFPETCSDWRSNEISSIGALGNSSNQDSSWSGQEDRTTVFACNSTRRLYCFQQS